MTSKSPKILTRFYRVADITTASPLIDRYLARYPQYRLQGYNVAKYEEGGVLVKVRFMKRA